MAGAPALGAVSPAGSPGPWPCGAPRNARRLGERGLDLGQDRLLRARGDDRLGRARRRERRSACPRRAHPAPAAPARRCGRRERTCRSRARSGVARAWSPSRVSLPGAEGSIRASLEVLQLVLRPSRAVGGERALRQHADPSLGAGDTKPASPAWASGRRDLVAVVEQLRDGAEGIAFHLVAAAGVLEVERRDDLRVRDPAAGAAPRRRRAKRRGARQRTPSHAKVARVRRAIWPATPGGDAGTRDGAGDARRACPDASGDGRRILNLSFAGEGSLPPGPAARTSEGVLAALQVLVLLASHSPEALVVPLALELD